MRKYILLIVTALLLTSCGQLEVSEKVVTKHHDTVNNSLNLSDKNIVGAVNLNEYADKVIETLYLSKNFIEVAHMEKLTSLRRIDLSDNRLAFMTDIKLPDSVIQLNLANNVMTDLTGLMNLENLKTIDLRGNKLTDSDIEPLLKFKALELIRIVGNPDISEEMMIQVNEFNKPYLETIQAQQEKHRGEVEKLEDYK